MYNSTFFEYYRKAIKAKYEREKQDEDSFNDLNPPTTAKLRDLCIKRFKSNTDKEDLEIFTSFFEFEFDPTKKNLITGKRVDKLKSIRRFFLGITDVPTEDTIHFAAILLDFQPRHFKKFCKVMEGKSEDEIMEELKLNNNYIDEEENIDVENVDEENVDEEEIKEKGQNLPTIPKKTRIKEKFKFITIGVLIVFGLGFIISRYAFPKKQCMQWSNDHYEKVDCDLSANGLIPFTIEPFDEIKFELKKVKVCDTTTCFKNGKPIIWYAKTGDAADFFNTHGIHPENEKALRPVTQYIFNKYKKPCGSK